jgi:predicted nucleic acid-binding Zn ribbon protein
VGRYANPLTPQQRAFLRNLDNACGTPEGWRQHRRLRQVPCSECNQAREAYERSKCGTYAGYQLHRRSKTRPCPACSEANAQRLRDWQAANPEKVRGYQSDYYERHREQRIAYSAAYRANHRPAA